MFEHAWEQLTEEEQEAITDRIELLQQQGPALRRPVCDVIKASRHRNMKELIAPLGSSEFRILFAFDPARTALLLLVGDKSPNDPTTPNWNAWYDTNIPIADDLFDRHIASFNF